MRQFIDVIKKSMYVMDRSQKILCLMVFGLTFIGSLLECLGVSVIIPLVTVILEPDTILNSSLVKGSKALSSFTYEQMVLLLCGGIIFLYVFKNLFFIFISWVRVKFSCKIEREMSVKMLGSYMSRGYQFFLNTNFGEFHRGVAGDATAVYVVLTSFFRIVSEAVTILFICAFMFVADWQLALIVLALAIVCLLIIYFGFRKQMYAAGLEARKYSIRVDQALAQSYFGIKDVLLLRRQKHFIYEFESNRIEAQKLQCKQSVAGESPGYMIEGICVAGLMLAVGIRIVEGGTDTGLMAVLAAFAAGAFRILPSLGRISSSLNSLTSTIPSIDALYNQVVQAEEYAEAHPEALVVVEEKSRKYGLISQSGKYDDLEKKEREQSSTEIYFKEKLELKNISFQYNDELGYVLKDINLTINKGQSIALIGPSGAGKSTLADILLGLLVPQEGGIYIDGVKITDIPDRWANTIGYVPQTVFLADTSIRNNVAFGESEAEIDDERVKEALERAELGEFITSLPEGVDTYVGDRGVRLSGGQRQRIAIARALYHRPEILVLDEATSALDNDTEAAIMSAIDSLQGEVTMIIVAHRLTTVKNCDIIYEVNHSGITVRRKEDVLGKG